MKASIVPLIGLICSYGMGACESLAPSLQLNVSHNLQEFVKKGDVFPLNFNISHATQSHSTAQNICVIWFLPGVFVFKGIQNRSRQFNVEKINGTGNFKTKVPEIALGESASGSLLVEYDPDTSFGEWYHEMVVPVQLLWYENDLAEQSPAVRMHHLPLMPYTVGVSVQGCLEPLGMSDGRIKDHYLDAGESDIELTPTKARPNEEAWCARDGTFGNFIQVAFSKLTQVTRLVTLGRRNKDQWVKKYNLNYSMDGSHWHSYKENGFAKAFHGTKGPAMVDLLFPMTTNFLRIIPIDWNKRICIRFEVFGCIVGTLDNCIDPIGIENGDVPDEAFTDSIDAPLEGNVMIKPANARLNKLVTEYPFGWMARHDKEDWLQIDLGSTFKITKVTLQGSGNSFHHLFYVKTYKIRYSNNGIDWMKIFNGDHEMAFNGPKTSMDAKEATAVILTKPVYGRYVRIIPVDFISSKVLRLELFGCVSNEEETHKRRSIGQDRDLNLRKRSVILDPVRDIFYACFRQVNEVRPSCVVNKAGKMWKTLDASVARLLGVDFVNDIVYGMDRQLSILAKRSSNEHWSVISEQQWTSAMKEPMIGRAVQLPDILIGKAPRSAYQWESESGTRWGVSGDGIHKKVAKDSPWQLVAIWKCCGF